MFTSKIFKGRQKYRPADRVRENYLIADLEKKNFFKGELILGHCRGNNTIYIMFLFEDCYENHIRLLPRNYGPL